MSKQTKKSISDQGGFVAKFQASLEHSIHEIESMKPEGFDLETDAAFRQMFDSLVDDQPLPEIEKARHHILKSHRSLLKVSHDVDRAFNDERAKSTLGENWQNDHNKAAHVLEVGYEAAKKQTDKMKGSVEEAKGDKQDEVGQTQDEKEALELLGMGDDDESGEQNVLSLLKDAERGVKRLTKKLPRGEEDKTKAFAEEVNKAFMIDVDKNGPVTS